MVRNSEKLKYATILLRYYFHILNVFHIKYSKQKCEKCWGCTWHWVLEHTRPPLPGSTGECHSHREGHNTECHPSCIIHCGVQCPGVGAQLHLKIVHFVLLGKICIGHLSNPSGPKGALASWNTLTQESHILCNLY